MALPPTRAPAATPLYQLAFTKLQIGIMVAALAALMALSFSLGFVTATRQEGNRRLARLPQGEAAPAERPGGQGGARLATVKLPPRDAGGGGKSTAPEAEPGFYKSLTAREPEKEGGAALEPIRLPEGAEPARAPRAAAPAVPARERAEPEPSPPRAKDPRAAPPAGGAYTIQILSVREYDRAERVLRALRGKGVYGYIERIDLGGRGVWHRLRVGRYPSRQAAERALEELRARARLGGGSVVPL